MFLFLHLSSLDEKRGMYTEHRVSKLGVDRITYLADGVVSGELAANCG